MESIQEEKEDTKCLDCPTRGICCHLEDYDEKENRIASDEACENLDPKTGLCTTFEQRHEQKFYWGHCLTLEEMMDENAVPIQCLYIGNKREYGKRKDRRHYSDFLLHQYAEQRSKEQ